jgi:hypothetical protein
MSRVPTPSTAFSVSRSDRKRPRQQNPKHLAWIRTLPCLITGLQEGTEAAHIRMADARYGKREVGKGEKADDRWTVPLNYQLHRAQHTMSERLWWEQMKVDPCRVALSLYNNTGDNAVAKTILSAALKLEG